MMIWLSIAAAASALLAAAVWHHAQRVRRQVRIEDQNTVELQEWDPASLCALRDDGDPLTRRLHEGDLDRPSLFLGLTRQFPVRVDWQPATFDDEWSALAGLGGRGSSCYPTTVLAPQVAAAARARDAAVLGERETGDG